MKHNRFVQWCLQHKKPLMIGAGVLLVLLVVLWFLGIFSSNSIDRTDTNASEQGTEPVTEASPLTGVQVEPSLAQRPVTALVIENSPDARPQSGLKQAGLVFEAIAEGGITRFVAFYQESQPGLIGPVRSMRPYFVDLVRTFDASIGHVGGSEKAMAEIQEFNLKDLDQFYNPQVYWRATDRYAPHNVYTNFKNLNKINKEKGFKKSQFESLPRKEPSPLESPKAKTISIPISSYLYQVDYKYDKASNKYSRFLAGEKHVDREKGTIKPTVVIAIEVPNSIIGGGRYDYELVGSGKAFIFQDGDVTKATWSRKDRSAQFIFKNKTGEEVKLNPGQTWITATSPGSGVNWKP